MNEVNKFEEIYEIEAAGHWIESVQSALHEGSRCLSGGEIYDISHLRNNVEFLLGWNLTNEIYSTFKGMIEVIETL